MGRPKGGGNSEARAKLIEAAGRGFRRAGFGGAGVDALAKDAGLTSGAFYAHFGSKSEAFRLAMIAGFKFLVGGIGLFQEKHGPEWKKPFVEFYFGERMKLGIEDACALPTFSAEAARADAPTRAAFDAELTKVHRALADGLRGKHADDRAWVLMALLAGGASVGRAVQDEALRASILAAVTDAAKEV